MTHSFRSENIALSVSLEACKDVDSTADSLSVLSRQSSRLLNELDRQITSTVSDISACVDTVYARQLSQKLEDDVTRFMSRHHERTEELNSLLS
jgi:hypothetical protein